MTAGGEGSARRAGDKVQVEVLPDEEALTVRAAELIAGAARQAVAERGRFGLVLAGGGTPRRAYERLAALPPDAVPWAATTVWFGDERCVPPDHAESNFAMAHRALLAHVPVGRVHRMAGELPPEEGARRYEAALREAAAGVGEAPLHDLLLLGMGADGHTASLFPDGAALAVHERWVTASVAPPDAPVRDRLTLTLPAIGLAREVVVLTAGAAKAEPARRALAPRPGDATPPVALVRGRERTAWLLDAAAAAPLAPGPGPGPGTG